MKRDSSKRVLYQRSPHLELMTAKQIAELFGYSENSIKTNFNRTAASIKKKYNVDIIRCEKQGKRYYQIFEDTRALTIYNEVNDIPISIESLSFEAYQFYVFLTLSASSQGVFRGRREDLLKYIGIKPNKKNIEVLNQVIKVLVEKECIAFHEDEDFIILYLRTKVENKYSISIDMMRECQRIANENHKNFNKIAQLEQVWQAIRICEENQPFTYADLAKITGLSYKQIRDVKRLLEENNAFVTNRAGSYLQCLGMNVELNGFYK